MFRILGFGILGFAELIGSRLGGFEGLIGLAGFRV